MPERAMRGKPQESSMSEMMTVRLDTVMTFSLSMHQDPATIDLSKVPDDVRQAWIQHYLIHGIKQATGDKGSTFKGTEAQKKAEVKKLYDLICEGHIPSGGGGRGASLSDMNQAMLDLLNEGKKAADKLKVSDFTKAASEYFRERVTKDCIAQGIDPRTADITNTVKDNLEAMIEERINDFEDGQECLKRVKINRKVVNVKNVTTGASKWLKKKEPVEPVA
jgi:hypothetical protein